MPDWKSRIAIGALVLIHVLGNLVSVPILARLQEYETVVAVVGLILLGGGMTQVVLLTIWAVRGVEPWLVRYARALFLVAVGLLASLIGVSRHENDMALGHNVEYVFLMPSATLILATTLATCFVAHVQNFLSARRLGHYETLDDTPRLRPNQFSLRRMGIWTAGIALLLGMSRTVSMDLASEGEFFSRWVFEGAVVGALTAAVFGIPLLLLALPIASLLLNERAQNPLALALKCAALATSIPLGEGILLLAFLFFASGFSIEEFTASFRDGWESILILQCFNLGVLIETVSVFAVVRACGFRFIRQPLAANSPIDRTSGTG